MFNRLATSPAVNNRSTCGGAATGFDLDDICTTGAGFLKTIMRIINSDNAVDTKSPHWVPTFLANDLMAISSASLKVVDVRYFTLSYLKPIDSGM
jgi:hypothetical protein